MFYIPLRFIRRGIIKSALTKCCNSRTSCAGQFVSRGFVVLLRKSNPQNHNLQTAVEHGVKFANQEDHRLMKEVERILRVDHAGEYGAINIYKAQLFVARLFYKEIVPQLEEMLSHEKVHFSTFNKILVARSIRRCYAIHFWAFGGFSLGLFTALIGRNAIWVCTNSIESTVLHHLEWQLEFLSKNDPEVHQAVLSIKADEEAHQEFGQTNGNNSLVYKPIFYIVRRATEFAIWLSAKL